MFKSMIFAGAVFAVAPFAAASAVGGGTNLGNVMPMGDSITAGVSIYTTEPGAWRSDFYTDLTGAGYTLQFVGSQETYPDATLTAANETRHEGHSGYTIANLDSILTYPVFAGQASVGYPLPNTILLMIGTNDIYDGFYAGADQRLMGLITDINADDPGVRLIVSSIPHFDGAAYAADNALIDQYNAGIQTDVAAAQAELWDTEFANIGPTLNSDADYADFIHPDEAGEQVLADGWEAAIEAAPVPEPASVGMLVAGSLAAFGRRTRCRRTV